MRLRRQGAILGLALILAAPWTAAAEPRFDNRDRAEPRIIAISDFLSHTWSLFKSLWGEEGSRMDPLGSPQTDAGSRMDPLGDPTTNAGSRADPLGFPEPTTDEGPRADPLG